MPNVTSPLSYMRKAAYREAISLKNALLRVPIDYGANDLQQSEVQEMGAGPEDYVNAIETAEAVMYVLDNAPEPTRWVCYLRFRDDLSIQDIVEVTKIPEGTVKRMLTSVREAIDDKLGSGRTSNV